MSMERLVIVEDILGEFGFRVQWLVKPHWADVEVFEIEAREEGVPLFTRANSVRSGEYECDINKSKKYLKGFVKFDGCTELDQGNPHWCGPVGYIKHINLLRYVYRRAFELMGSPAPIIWEEDNENQN